MRDFSGQWNQGICKKVLRLCVVGNEEFKKCQWLKEGIITEGIEPRLECVQADNIWSCFNYVKNKTADFFAIDSEYSFIANKYNILLIINNILAWQMLSGKKRVQGQNCVTSVNNAL